MATQRTPATGLQADAHQVCRKLELQQLGGDARCMYDQSISRIPLTAVHSTPATGLEAVAHQVCRKLELQELGDAGEDVAPPLDSRND